MHFDNIGVSRHLMVAPEKAFFWTFVSVSSSFEFFLFTIKVLPKIQRIYVYMGCVCLGEW